MSDYFDLIEPARQRFSDALAIARDRYKVGELTKQQFEDAITDANEAFIKAKKEAIEKIPIEDR